MKIRKNGRKPSRRNVIWLGTVQMRGFILIKNSVIQRLFSGNWQRMRFPEPVLGYPQKWGHSEGIPKNLNRPDSANSAFVEIRFAPDDRCGIFAARKVSGEFAEIFLKRTAEFARKELVHRRDGPRRLVERDTLHTMHGKENRGESHALAVRFVHLANEMVKRIQVNAAQRDAGRIDGQQFSPYFFLGGVQTDNHDGMRVHEFKCPVF